MIHEYRTGRSVCGFVEFCAWAGVVVAAIMVLAALGTSTRGGGYTFALAGVVPALTLLIFSFILVVLTQMARACMDGSVAAQKNVIQNQKHHEETIRALRSYASRSPSGDAQAAGPKPSLADAVAKGADEPVKTSTATAATTTAPKAPTVTEYKGHQIHHEGTKLRVEGVNFSTLESAKTHIDRLVGEVPGTGRREPVLSAPKGLG